jgi:hypothetical protein
MKLLPQELLIRWKSISGIVTPYESMIECLGSLLSRLVGEKVDR